MPPLKLNSAFQCEAENKPTYVSTVCNWRGTSSSEESVCIHCNLHVLTMLHINV